MHKDRQLDDLMAGLRETLEALPDDGREHRVEIQVGPHNSGNVAGGNQYIVKLGPEEPTRPEASRICPQCHKATWRSTRECIHCGLDLFAHDHAVWLAGVQQRAQRSMVFFGILGVGLLFGSHYLPKGASVWGGLLGLGCLFIAAASGRRAEIAGQQ